MVPRPLTFMVGTVDREVDDDIETPVAALFIAGVEDPIWVDPDGGYIEFRYGDSGEAASATEIVADRLRALLREDS